MKKIKPWVLTLATLTVASAGISAISINVQTSSIEQNNYLQKQNLDLRNYSRSINTRHGVGGTGGKDHGYWNQLTKNKLDLNQDGLKIKNTPNNKQQILVSNWIDELGTNSSFKDILLESFFNDFKDAYKQFLYSTDRFQKDETFNIDDPNNWDQYFKNQISDLMTVNVKAKEYYDVLQQPNNKNINDLSTRTQDFYNKRKIINNYGYFYLKNKHDSGAAQLLGGIQTNGYTIGSKALVDKDLHDYFLSTKTLFEKYIYKKGVGKYDGYLEVVIKFRFDKKSGLDINELHKYINVSSDKKSFIFDLEKMKNDFNNWDALTKKEQVFDNNGLHDYFDVTYEEFWTKVKEVVKQKGLNIDSLQVNDFKNNNIYVPKTRNKRNLDTVDKVISSDKNNIQNPNGKPNNFGWEQPTNGVSGLNTLTYKVDTTSPKYEAGNKDNILNNIEIKDNNLTSNDKLEDSQNEVIILEENKKKLDEFEKQLGISSTTNFNSSRTSFDNEIEKQQKEIQTLKSSASEIDTKISQANAKWQEELTTILGSNNTGLNLNSNAKEFIKKWNEVIKEYDTKLNDAVDIFKQEYEKVMSQKTNYRPHNWLWLVSGFEQNSVVLKDFEQQANALNKLYKERDTKLNDLLKDNDVLNELKTLKDNHFKTIQNDIDEKTKKIKEIEDALVKNVENKLNDIKQENIRIKNISRDTNDQAVINATLQMKQGANLYQPIQPEDDWFDGSQFWYAQENQNSIRKLYSRKDVVDAINDKVITLIKSKDTDFNLTPQDHPVVTEKSLTLLNADGQSHTIKEERGKLGSGDHEYQVSVSTTYKIDPSTKKIEKLEFNVNAVNQTIVKNNEAINDIVKRTQEIDKKVNEYQQKVEEVFNTEIDGNNGVIKTYQDKQTNLNTELNKTIQSSDLTNLVTYDLSKEFITKINNEVKNVKNFGYYTKLNWWVLLIAILIIILVLLLLILLFIFINKNQQKYRYTV